MAYDANGNYIKSANELAAYLNDSGQAFTDPAFLNTNSIFDMNPIMPVSNASGKDTNILSNISTNVQKMFGGAGSSSVTNILIVGLAVGLAVKLFKRGR